MSSKIIISCLVGMYALGNLCWNIGREERFSALAQGGIGCLSDIDGWVEFFFSNQREERVVPFDMRMARMGV